MRGGITLSSHSKYAMPAVDEIWDQRSREGLRTWHDLHYAAVLLPEKELKELQCTWHDLHHVAVLLPERLQPAARRQAVVERSRHQLGLPVSAVSVGDQHRGVSTE